MTQEQKALAYDEALDRARKVHKYSSDLAEIKRMEYLFPELCKNEDEKIRKSLLRWLQSNSYTSIAGIQINDIIAWLEKQGTSYTKRDVDDAYVEGMAFAKDELEKQGEQKISEYDAVKTIKERIIEHFDNHLIIDKCFSIGGLKDDILKIINEVKFEKQGEQKPVWNEEDEEFLRRAINATKDTYPMTAKWLKSLKQRHTWKPSDEQMKELEITARLANPTTKKVLNELLEQLKKL